MSRILIVNADDFGRSRGINRGVVRAHEQGIVTSASLMVGYPGSAEAAEYARGREGLSLGLHVDLGEWELVGGEWRELYARQPPDAEIESQLEEFRALVGAEPTHLDSHQHVHREEPVRSLLAELAEALSVPLRGFTPDVRYVGDFYGQDRAGAALPDAIGVDALLALLRGLPEGTTELGCHPGEPDGSAFPYREERAVEVETLCDPRVRAVLVAERIELRSFPPPRLLAGGGPAAPLPPSGDAA